MFQPGLHCDVLDLQLQVHTYLARFNAFWRQLLHYLPRDAPACELVVVKFIVHSII
jgi:hypothetical protein